MKFRIIACLLLILFVFVGTVTASPIIRADKTYYDLDKGIYVLDGNVYVEVKDRIVTAGHAKVSLSSLEVWGSGGITLTQGDISFAATSVHVFGTKSKALIEGDVTLQRPGLSIVADTADFNWKTKIAIFNGNVKVTQNGHVWHASSVSYNVTTGELITSF